MWSFYIVDGRIVANPLMAKLLQTYASLTGRGHAVAFVALSTPEDHTGASAAEVLQRFVSSLPEFDRYVAALR